MCQRVVDSGHSIKFNNEYYRFINKLGNPIYFNKDTKCTVIKALDGQLFATVDESIFALEKISEVQSKSENFDDIEEVKERKIVQSRTKNNGNPNNNQIRFLNNWEKEVLNKAA